MSNIELGYTPNNLKTLLKKHNKSREDLADFFGMNNVKSIHCWCVESTRRSHKSMSHKKWLMFLEWIGES